MKIALIGYGAMGRLIERLAIERGHEIVAVIDERNAGDDVDALVGQLKNADAAIDFSVAEAIVKNAAACAKAGVALVVGTTGWLDNVDEIKAIVAENNAAFLYGANFSIGVNIFYKIVAAAGIAFKNFAEYEGFIEERHHSRKKDAPSGTALKIKEIAEKTSGKTIETASVRAGNIPGTHTIGFAGQFDEITLTHTARSREGFAAGAVTAAEWIAGKRGFFEFTDVVDGIIGEGNHG